jgi:hypothetical protein
VANPAVQRLIAAWRKPRPAVRIASLGEGFPRRFSQNNWKRKTYFLERAVMDDCGAMDANRSALCC